MRLLLDTHVWIWWLTDSSELTSDVIEVIEAEATELFLSPVSIWETLILAQKGRLDLGRDPEGWIRQALAAFLTIEALLNTEIAILSRKITLGHDDPADRFLAATALIYEAQLVTKDRRLLSAESVPTFG